MQEMESLFLSTVARLSGRIDGLESGTHTSSAAVIITTTTATTVPLGGKHSARGSSNSNNNSGRDNNNNNNNNNNNDNNNNSSVYDKPSIYPPIPDSTSKHPLRKALNYSQKSMVTDTTGTTKRS